MAVINTSAFPTHDFLSEESYSSDEVVPLVRCYFIQCKKCKLSLEYYQEKTTTIKNLYKYTEHYIVSLNRIQLYYSNTEFSNLNLLTCDEYVIKGILE